MCKINKDDPQATVIEKVTEKCCHKNENECDDVMPIQIAIVGEWKPIASFNTDVFLAKRKSNPFSDIMFQSASHKFQFHGPKMTYRQYLGSEKFYELVSYLGHVNKKLKATVITRIEKNVLRTTHIRNEKYGDSEFDHEDRFIKNGQLHIINQCFGVTCARIFDRVEVFNLGSKIDEPIDQLIFGTWKKIGSKGIREFARNGTIDAKEQVLWEEGFKYFGMINDTIHMKHYGSSEVSDRQHILGSPIIDTIDGIKVITLFEDNNLITKDIYIDTKKEKSRVVRCVKDGRLFVTRHQDNMSFMCIYERI